ncbi:MAG: hypothetical protein MUC81_04575 [Bacteroidia bacterium]|jgi:hypothetical protein|nr:hypothetical protein [Bacteroidia bacterium]
MTWIEDIKNFIGRMLLLREINARKTQPKRIGFSTIQHVGIVYNAANKENEQLIAQYANALRSEGKKVFMLGYVDTKQLPHTKKFLLNSEFFWKEKLNGFNLPIKGSIGSFLQTDFDLLLNLYLEPILPMQAISAYSKAKYVVGSYLDGGLNYYDAMIDIGQGNNLKNLIEEIDFYIRAIK